MRICTHLKGGDRDKALQFACNNEAVERLVFHTGLEAYVCKEHAKLGRTIEHLIIGREVVA